MKLVDESYFDLCVIDLHHGVVLVIAVEGLLDVYFLRGLRRWLFEWHLQ